jgi:hypothetical protein
MPVTTVPSSVPATTGTASDILRLYDRVQALLPGVTLPIVQMMLWDAIEEFCIRSNYFRAKIYWEMQPGVYSVNFNPFSADLVVIWVIKQHGLVDWEINPPGELVDLSEPNAARTGWAIVVLGPIEFDDTKLDNLLPELFTTWYETMLDGTLFRLYQMPTRPWSSPQQASYHGTRFRQGMMRARDIAERLHSEQQAPARRYPYFAHGRRKN